LVKSLQYGVKASSSLLPRPFIEEEGDGLMVAVPDPRVRILGEYLEGDVK
jgi:hypothetical protein